MHEEENTNDLSPVTQRLHEMALCGSMKAFKEGLAAAVKAGVVDERNERGPMPLHIAVQLSVDPDLASRKAQALLAAGAGGQPADERSAAGRTG